MRRDLSILLVFFLLATFLPARAQEISPAQVILVSQSDAPILFASDFAIAEDGVIFIPDGKDGNIKCYEPDGTLLKVIGRRGPGPEEFRTPAFCDYKAPFLSVLDAFKIHIYERKGRGELVKVAEISCMACTSDVILSGKGVLVDAYVHYNDGKFCLTLRSFDDTVKHLLPNYRRYGFESEGEYNASYLDLSMLTAQRGFLSVLGNRIYFVFDARPIVMSLNLDGSGIATFRTLSPNYREPRLNARIRDAFYKPGREGELKAERNKVSCITGILADDQMVGVLFSNYDAPSETWKLYLQRFDKAGKLVSESLLREAVNYGPFFSYYFQRESGVLYVMAERYGDDSTDDYRILGYKLR
jgi:hypothetical protein